MNLLESQARRQLHDHVLALRKAQYDVYICYALMVCSAVTVSFYYILNVSVFLNVVMSLLNGLGFFYIGRSYAIVTRKLKSMKKSYNDAFRLERVS